MHCVPRKKRGHGNGRSVAEIGYVGENADCGRHDVNVIKKSHEKFFDLILAFFVELLLCNNMAMDIIMIAPSEVLVSNIMKYKLHN